MGGIQNNLKIRDSSYVSQFVTQPFLVSSRYAPPLHDPGRLFPRIHFYGSEIRHGIFWGLNFGPETSFGFGLFEALGIFLGVDFCPHSIISGHLKSGVSPGAKSLPFHIPEARKWYPFWAECVLQC